jgi:hypothetical protein
MVKKLNRKQFENTLFEDKKNGLSYGYAIQINDVQDEEYLINFLQSLGFTDNDYCLYNWEINNLVVYSRLYRFIILRSGINKVYYELEGYELIKLKNN